MPEPDAFSMGDFSKPIVPPKTTEDVLKSAESKLNTEAAAVEAEMRPMASYEEALKQIGVSREEAAKIVDAILLKGYWSEEVKITKTIRARFRTRNQRDVKRAQNYIETQRPNYEAHYNELLTRQLLAASLEKFGPDAFEHPDRKASSDDVERSFENRFVYVETLADPAFRMLSRKLVVFDEKIRVVMQEGAIENF